MARSTRRRPVPSLVHRRPGARRKGDTAPARPVAATSRVPAAAAPSRAALSCPAPAADPAPVGPESCPVRAYLGRRAFGLAGHKQPQLAPVVTVRRRHKLCSSPSVHSPSAGTGAQGGDAAKAAAGGQPTGLPPQTAPLTQQLANTPLAAQPPAPTPPPAPAPVPDAPAPPPSAPAPSAPAPRRATAATCRRRPRRWHPSGALDATRTAAHASSGGTVGASRRDGPGRHIDRAWRRAHLRGRCDQRCGSACARTGFSLARRARRDRRRRDRWSVAPPIHRR